MATTRDLRRLAVESLAWRCDAKQLEFASTAELAPEVQIIGQERALRALKFGLAVAQVGYNIFVSGAPGTGRSTYTRAEVERAAAACPTPPDWCYVRNFSNGSQPTAISLPAGRGRTFQHDVAEMIAEVRDGLRRAFASEVYERRRTEIVKQYEQAVSGIWQKLEEQARQQGLLLQRTPAGVVTVPIDLQGRPISEEVFQQLPEADRERIVQRTQGLQDAVSDTLRQIRAKEREGRETLRALEQQTAQYMIDVPVSRVKEQYGEYPAVVAFLGAAEQDMLEHLSEIRGDGDEEGGTPRFELPIPRRDPLARYQVNLFVSHQEGTRAPVVVEPNPTYYNLVGKTEYRAEFGAMVTDFTMIKPGALHLANGGYLILQVRDVLTNAFAYEGLKRALRSQQIRIESLGESLGMLPTATLKPDPIPLQTKVVLIGTPDLYHLLYALDEEFEKLFKIRADFDVVMDRTPDTIQEYARAIAGICYRNQLCHLEPGAVARVLEYSARLAAQQDKLSTRFNEVVEIIFEATAWARQAGSEMVTREHVQRAIDEKAARSNLVEEKIREMITRGQILVDTDGAVTGQINGLSVLQLGDYTFGQPSRITARVYVGSRGVVNIERETQMSGRIHSKGVFVLSSFLASRFAQQQPLSVSASLTFEQLYSDVDGDSASSTELYALLSELAGLPIDQGIATTGSVNQMGEIQPIGGVNEKIEGFYYVCKAKGLTGRQGVVIPHQNVSDLMLRDEIVDAVREGRFHVWAVHNVDEGIEILTGSPAGERDEAGRYPADSVNGRVTARLAELAARYREFTESGERPDDGKKNNGPPPASVH
jgi:predicted ATP-dependent protease